MHDIEKFSVSSVMHDWHATLCMGLVSKYLSFSPPFTTKYFTSVPYMLVAKQV